MALLSDRLPVGTFIFKIVKAFHRTDVYVALEKQIMGFVVLVVVYQPFEVKDASDLRNQGVLRFRCINLK